MNIREVKTFVQEHDWRIIVTAVGLAVIASLPPTHEIDSSYEVCLDRVTQSPDLVPISSSVSADTR